MKNFTGDQTATWKEEGFRFPNPPVVTGGQVFRCGSEGAWLIEGDQRTKVDVERQDEWIWTVDGLPGWRHFDRPSVGMLAFSGEAVQAIRLLFENIRSHE